MFLERLKDIRPRAAKRGAMPAPEILWQDVRYAVRTLVRAPAFSLVAVLSLALGIGANTALFSLMDVMLLRALPVKSPQQLVEFVRSHPSGSMVTNLPYPVFEYFRRDPRVLSDVLGISWSNPVFQASAAPERTSAHEVSGSFFPSLGVPPLLGRAIGREDDRPGAPSRVAVVSYGFWSRQFGRDPSALGAAVRLSGERFTIIGVMPPRFFGLDRGEVPDLWIPLAADPDPGQIWVLGRLRPGVSLARARAELDPVFHQALESLRGTMQDYSERQRNAFFAQRLLVNRATEGASGVRWSYWDYSATLKILAGLSGLVLLIACANLANLLMARAAARSREISIRLALGAGRWRLIRQLMTESLLLSLVGGGIGLLMAGWGHRLLVGFLVRDPLSVAFDFQPDYRLLGFAMGLSAATGLLFGILPALRAVRAGIAESIGNARRRSAMNLPLAKGFLAIQISLSMILLTGAGLFARSLRNLGAADLGFARENLLLIDVRASAGQPRERQQFWREVSRRLSTLPGIGSMALAGDAVFGNGGWNETIWVERPGQPVLDAQVSDNLVGPGFFATAGIPILKGREFGEQDRPEAQQVALVNRAFAVRFLGGDDPIGKRFGDAGPTSIHRYEVVGLVGDAKYGSVREPTRPMVFHALWQAPPRASCVVHVRTIGEPRGLLPAIRREIQAADSQALVGNIRTAPEAIRSQLRQDRMFAVLAGFFALLALALGGIGIYGMVAYRVARRTAEIGIRIALGARRRNVLWLVVRDTLALLSAGVAAGSLAALLAGRLIKSLLFALDPFDPPTLAVAAAVLFAAGAMAGYLPARRAASVEPSVALRSE